MLSILLWDSGKLLLVFLFIVTLCFILRLWMPSNHNNTNCKNEWIFTVIIIYNDFIYKIVSDSVLANSEAFFFFVYSTKRWSIYNDKPSVFVKTTVLYPLDK